MTALKRARVRLTTGETPERTAHGAVLLDRPATRADLDKLPRTWRGEIIHGTLYAFPRPRGPHQATSGSIHADLRNPFGRGRGGPGGWLLLIEPGIELPGEDEFSPDVAGWRRERLARVPSKGPITLAPDWICEVLSRRTRGYDQVTKRRFYAEIGVPYLWYVDPLARLLTASKLEGGRWVELGAWGENEKVRVEPFEAAELDLADWWRDIEAEDEDGEASPVPPSTTS
jgi:Uma2 family endonuclease